MNETKYKYFLQTNTNYNFYLRYIACDIHDLLISMYQLDPSRVDENQFMMQIYYI